MIETAATHYCLHPTPFGTVAILWGESKIRRILLSRPQLPAESILKTSFANSSPGSCPEIDAVAEAVVAALNGEEVRFSLDAVALDLCSGFQRGVLRAEHAVPRGGVTTYKLLAAHLGNPLAARAVGTALASNPFPVIVPCHRTIRTDGTLGGYQGGSAMKMALLTMEGIAFDPGGRVVVDGCHYSLK